MSPFSRGDVFPAGYCVMSGANAEVNLIGHNRAGMKSRISPLLLTVLALLLASCSMTRPKAPPSSEIPKQDLLPEPPLKDPQLRAAVDAAYAYEKSAELAIAHAQLDPTLPREATPTDGSYFQTHLTWTLDEETFAGSLDSSP